MLCTQTSAHCESESVQYVFRPRHLFEVCYECNTRQSRKPLPFHVDRSTYLPTRRFFLVHEVFQFLHITFACACNTCQREKMREGHDNPSAIQQ